MKNKKKIIIWGIVILLLFILEIIYSNSINARLRESIYDDELYFIDESVITLEVANDYARKRVFEWAEEAYLSSVFVTFSGEDEIRDREGLIEMYFDGTKDREKCLPANINVDVDMKCKAGTFFGVGYDQRLVGKTTYEGGRRIIDREKKDQVLLEEWIIGIEDIFEIAYSEVSIEEILKYDNPEVGIVAGSRGCTFYAVNVIPVTKPYKDFEYETICRFLIDPTTGEILEKEIN